MRILLAVDGSAPSEAAAQAVLAQFPPLRTDVCVLHADEWPRDLPPSLSFAEGPAAAGDILTLHDLRRQNAEAMVAGVADRLRSAGFRVSTIVREGDPRHAILDAASDWRPDVIVLGSHGRRGLNRFLLGSVSESVARHAPCSVQIVRAPAVEPAA
jgi:nucleotide-binding universal stress UspA family protein